MRRRNMIQTDRDIAAFLLQPEWRAGKKYSLQEQQRLKEEIERKTKSDRIEIALAAFPFKMQNPLKTVGNTIDCGELIALRRLKEIAQGAATRGYELSWHIITDGAYYADELQTPRTAAAEYKQAIEDLARHLEVPATFVELDTLVKKHSCKRVHPLDYTDAEQRPYIFRTAGIMYSRHYTGMLQEFYRETGSVPAAIEKLVETEKDFQRGAAQAAALYQAQKHTVEEQDIFGTHFPNAVRASIQPDVNRNLATTEIVRPLSIRITESNRKNLFPWLGVGCRDEEWFNVYAADAIATGKETKQEAGLVYFS